MPGQQRARARMVFTLSVAVFAVACSREPAVPNGADTTRVVAQSAQNDGAEVHNHVYTQAFGTGWAGRVYLPNVELWVRNVATNVDSVHVLSDANGFFGVPRQPAATYRLCWSAAGFGSGCQTSNFTLADETFVMPIHLPLVPVRPLLWGHALLRDGSVPLAQNSFFGVNVAARVRLVNQATNATVSSEAQVNAQGLYAVGDAPA